MNWTNFHTHCRFCDGVGEPQEFVDEAVRQGIKALGFSCNAPLPFPAPGVMKIEDLAAYCETIRSLKQSNADKLRVFLSLEIDYIPDISGPKKAQYQALGLDYTIGAIHFLKHHTADNPWQIDGSPVIFSEGLRKIYGGDIRLVVETYYRLIRRMVQTEKPDIIAHLDLIKKNNPHEKYFSESEIWYRDAVLETLETIANSGSILEVNTGGIARKRTDSLYPSIWILKHCRELGIPITLNSDAHNPKQIAALFEETAAILKEIGISEPYCMEHCGWKPFSYSVEGFS